MPLHLPIILVAVIGVFMLWLVTVAISGKDETMDKTKLVVEKVAFEEEKRGFVFKASYLKEPKGDALIEISKGGQLIKEFLFPSYKIWKRFSPGSS